MSETPQHCTTCRCFADPQGKRGIPYFTYWEETRGTTDRSSTSEVAEEYVRRPRQSPQVGELSDP